MIQMQCSSVALVGFTPKLNKPGFFPHASVKLIFTLFVLGVPIKYVLKLRVCNLGCLSEFMVLFIKYTFQVPSLEKLVLSLKAIWLFSKFPRWYQCWELRLAEQWTRNQDTHVLILLHSCLPEPVSYSVKRRDRRPVLLSLVLSMGAWVKEFWKAICVFMTGGSWQLVVRPHLQTGLGFSHLETFPHGFSWPACSITPC